MSAHSAITLVLASLGAVFMLLAGWGLIHMPDLLLRMSAAAKASTLGTGLILLAAAVYFQDLGVTSRALVTIAFVFLTTPVAAHRIARAAYFAGVPLWAGTQRDELAGRYDPCTHELEGVCEADWLDVPMAGE